MRTERGGDDGPPADSPSELYDRFLDAALAGDCEEPAAFLARHGRDDPSLLARLGSLHRLALRRALRQAPALEVERIGGFRILRPLGRGGMGEVYVAERERDGELAALKVMRGAFRDEPEALERFLREIRAVEQLAHEHIVPVLDSGSEDGVLFVAFALIDGQDLAAHLREHGPLPCPEALRWAAAIARALHHAHGRGLIHRDVKPANILIRTGGCPLLIDFGLARDAKGELSTLTRSFVGTPGYAAPEQRLGSCDARSDVYGLGATLYRCLSGRLPFEDARTDLASLLARRLPPIGRDDLVPGLEEVLERALCSDPRSRYASAEELARALEALARGAAAEPSPREALHAPPAPRPRRSWRRPALAFAVFACALGAAFLLPGGAPSTPEPSLRRAFDFARPEASAAFRSEGVAPWRPPDGDALLFRASRGWLALPDSVAVLGLGARFALTGSGGVGVGLAGPEGQLLVRCERFGQAVRGTLIAPGLRESRALPAPPGERWELALRWRADTLRCSLGGQTWLRVPLALPRGRPGVWLDTRRAGAELALHGVWLEQRSLR